MADSSVYGLLHAYALGCLNNESFKELKNYFRSGQSFEWSELGEFQNLAAMLPSILNIEPPPHQLKDKVARKLYRIREERRKTLVDLHKITQLSTPEIKIETPQAAPPPPLPSIPKEEVPPKFDPGFARVTQERMIDINGPLSGITHEDMESILAKNEQEFNKKNLYETKFELDADAIDNWQEPAVPESPELKTARYKVTREIIPPVQKPEEKRFKKTEEKPKEKPEEKPAFTPPVQNPILERLSGGSFNPDFNEPDEKGGTEKGRTGIWIAIFLLFLLLLAIAAGGYYLYMQNTKNTKEIERLRQQVMSQVQKEDSINELLAILNSREFKVADLRPLSDQTEGFGKIIMSFDLKIAYFQFAQLPVLPEGKTYQLWANISGSVMSLGQFNPQGAINYEPLPKLPVIDKDLTVSFLLTEEKSDGAANPSKKVFLSGKI